MLCHHQHASETPFKLRFAGGPMMARLKCFLDPSTHQKRCQSWTPSDRIFWIPAWYYWKNFQKKKKKKKKKKKNQQTTESLKNTQGTMSNMYARKEKGTHFF